MMTDTILNGHPGDSVIVTRAAPLDVPWLPPSEATLPPRAEPAVPTAAQPAAQVPAPAPQPDTAAAAATATAGMSRTRKSIDGDTVIRLLTAAVVLGVAAFAAVVSYSHIFDLARRHSQDGTAARLLPLSIDGLIAAASLVMLHAGRNGLPVPRLARGMLATGVVATVAANVLYAVPPQWIGTAWAALIGAAISAFPAVAFIGSVEMMIRFVRDARAATAACAAGGENRDSDDDRDGDKNSDKPPPKQPRGKTAQARAAALLTRQPGLSNADVARRLKIDVRTVQRARDNIRKENAGHA